MRSIDADALLTELNNIKYPGAPYVDAGIRIAVGKICDAQTIEPERKTGKWVCDTCSKCGKNLWDYFHFTEDGRIIEEPNFCPNCGADMRGEQDG